MRQLTVRLFGGMELCHEDLGRLTFPTRRARSIFAFLSMHRGRFYPRDVLCGLVWRETPESVARKGLRTALWRIRQVLDEIPADTEALVRSDGVQVGIPDEATLWVDVPEFEELTAVLAGPWNPRLGAAAPRRSARARPSGVDAVSLRPGKPARRGSALSGIPAAPAAGARYRAHDRDPGALRVDPRGTAAPGPRAPGPRGPGAGAHKAPPRLGGLAFARVSPPGAGGVRGRFEDLSSTRSSRSPRPTPSDPRPWPSRWWLGRSGAARS